MNKTISCNDEIGPDDLRGRFLETVADIAYQAGVVQFYSGDSRADATMFINWAREFEKARQVCNGEELYFGENYMSSIEKFTETKLCAAVEAEQCRALLANYRRAELGVDGDHAYALLGPNLQEGESEWIKIEDLDDLEEVIGGCKMALDNLRKRLHAPKLSYYFGESHPYGKY